MFFGLKSPCTNTRRVVPVVATNANKGRARSGWARAVATRYGSRRIAWNERVGGKARRDVRRVGRCGVDAAEHVADRPCGPPVGFPVEQHLFQTGYSSGGEPGHGEGAGLAVLAENRGHGARHDPPATRIHSTSQRLRSTGARQSAATLSRPNARLTQMTLPGRSAR